MCKEAGYEMPSKENIIDSNSVSSSVPLEVFKFQIVHIQNAQSDFLQIHNAFKYCSVGETADSLQLKKATDSNKQLYSALIISHAE